MCIRDRSYYKLQPPGMENLESQNNSTILGNKPLESKKESSGQKSKIKSPENNEDINRFLLAEIGLLTSGIYKNEITKSLTITKENVKTISPPPTKPKPTVPTPPPPPTKPPYPPFFMPPMILGMEPALPGPTIPLGNVKNVELDIVYAFNKLWKQ